jgi:hypothetical protein
MNAMRSVSIGSSELSTLSMSDRLFDIGALRCSSSRNGLTAQYRHLVEQLDHGRYPNL